MLPITGKHASRNTMTIITYFHRPKRAWKRKAQAAAIAGLMIVTAKHPRRHGSFGDVPDMTPEEHKRRGDAADALFREMKRQIAASKRS